MEYFKSLTTKSLIEFIGETQKCLYVCLPSLHADLSKAIVNLNSVHNVIGNKVDIKVLIDFDAQTFRQGYGDFNEVEQFARTKFDIKSLTDNRISFIISDDKGYYLFVESRSLIPAEKSTINAVKIDAVSIVRLKRYFFGKSDEKDYENELANAIVAESKKLADSEELIPEMVAPVIDIAEEQLKLVKEDLRNNPPLNPNYKRIVDFYSGKFQYVRLKFIGANLQQRKIELPPDALPLMDASLKAKLETKLNLFDKDDTELQFESLQEFKAKLNTVREKYLKKVKSREESLLAIGEKTKFESELDALRNTIGQLKSDSIEVIASHMELLQESLERDLLEFLEANPKVLYRGFKEPSIFDEDKMLKSAQSKAKRIVYGMVKWPEPEELVEKFDINVKYSDITYEDLRNKDYIVELKEIGLITEADEKKLADFSRGIALS